MKFSVSSFDLQKVLIKAGSVIPSKSTMPILENYLFKLKDDNLEITATDMEISIVTSIGVTGEQNGSIVIPAKRLMETIRALPNITLRFSIDTNSNKIVMQTDKGEYKLTGQPASEYPEIPHLKDEEQILIETNLLKKFINKTVFAASTDELRPAMTGVLFQLKKGQLRAVATDGHRLVKITNTSFDDLKRERDVIIPTKSLNVISKYFDEKLKSLSIDDTNVLFNFGETTLISRVIDESYPNYESVIPSDNKLSLIVNKNELLSSVKRTSLYASTTTHQVRFSLNKKTMSISAEDIDFGSEAKETIPCEFVDDTLEIGFNANYIADMLTHLEDEEIEFLLSTPSKAVMIMPKNQCENEELLMLVMPVRLSS
jgi:DNA polymerase III subunit beta